MNIVIDSDIEDLFRKMYVIPDELKKEYNLKLDLNANLKNVKSYNIRKNRVLKILQIVKNIYQDKPTM